MYETSEDYMGQYGIVWNSCVVEVASTTCADIIEEILISVICTPICTPNVEASIKGYVCQSETKGLQNSNAVVFSDPNSAIRHHNFIPVPLYFLNPLCSLAFPLIYRVR